MSMLTSFKFNGNVIRTVNVGEKIWFVADDVCNVLDIPRYELFYNMRLKYLNRVLDPVSHHSGYIGVILETVISESGLYELASDVSIDVEEQFKRFVSDTVSPFFQLNNLNLALGGYL